MESNIEQKIKGDNNDQSINKTENSNNTIQENNTLVSMKNANNNYIQINENANLCDLIKVFTLCIKEQEPLIIEKAAQKATERVEFLTDELRRILTKQTITSEKINSLLEDPNFIYFIKDARESTIKSEKTTIKSIAELINLRLKTTSDNMLSKSLSESVSIIPKLLPIHFQMLSIIYLLQEVHLFSNNLDSLINKYENYFDMFSEIQNEYKNSTYNHLEFCNCAKSNSIRINSKLIDFIYNEYNEFTTNGISMDCIPSDLLSVTQKYGIQFKIKPDKKEIIIDLKSYNKVKNILLPKDDEILSSFINNKIDKDMFTKMIEEKHPKFIAFAKWWDDSVLSNMHLSNIGITIAISYLNSLTDSNFSYEIWI